MDYEIVECPIFHDHRGRLIEVLRADELPETFRSFGQIYAVTFDRPGQVRGNHYHTRSAEWFGVIAGELEVVLEDVRTGERKELVLCREANRFLRLMVGPLVAHAFRNLSPTAVLLDYSSAQYNRQEPDRVQYVLIPPDGD